MKRIVTALFCACLGWTGFATDYTFTWDKAFPDDGTAKLYKDSDGVTRAKLTFFYTNLTKTAGSPKNWCVDKVYIYAGRGDTITFDGEPMTFVMPVARSCFYFYTNETKVVFKNIVSNNYTSVNWSGGTAVIENSVSWNGGDTFLGTGWTTILKDLDLTAVEPYAENMPSAGTTHTKCLNAGKTHYVSMMMRHPGRVTWQYQTNPLQATDVRTGATRWLVRVIKAEAKQEGADIAARVLSAWSVWSDAKKEVGFDVDTIDIGADKVPVAIYDGTDTFSGYGVNFVYCMRVKPYGSVEYRNASTHTSTIEPGAHMEAFVAGVDPADVAGDARFNVPGETSIGGFRDGSGHWMRTGNLSGKGRVVFETTEDVAGDGVDFEYDGDWWITPTIHNMAAGRVVADIATATNMPVSLSYPDGASDGAPSDTAAATWAYIAGAVAGGAAGETEHPANVFNLKYTDSQMTNVVGQLQCQQGDRIHCIYVRFRRKNNTIDVVRWGTEIYTAYITNAYGKVVYDHLGVDFDDIRKNWNKPMGTGTAGIISSYVTTATGSGLGYHGIHLAFRHTPGNLLRLERSSGYNVMTSGGQFIVRGNGHANGHMTVSLLSRELYMVSNGVMRVENGGELIADNYNSYYSYPCQIWVTQGGIFRQRAANPFGTGSALLADGGALEFGYQQTAMSIPCLTYRISLKNGAHCYASDLGLDGSSKFITHMCSSADNCFAVGGDAPSTNDCSMVLMTSKNKIGTNNFVVAKTGDFEADLVNNGDIRRYHGSAPYWGACFRKSGDGTMLLNGDLTVTNVAILAQGTLKLGADCAWWNSDNRVRAPLVFEGGDLATVAGADKSLGAIARVTADATVTVGAGATLSFEDSAASAAGWTDGKIRFVVPDGSRVRFGTSAAGLTAAQLAHVRVNGLRVRIDDSGYLAPQGIIIVIR